MVLWKGVHKVNRERERRAHTLKIKTGEQRILMSIVLISIRNQEYDTPEERI
jgi:hypothetical protein